MNVILKIDDSVAIKHNGKLGMIKSQMGKETQDSNEENWYEVSTDIGVVEHYKESDLVADMFDHIKLLPIEVQEILEGFNEDEDSYKELARLHNELGVLGYEFEYYLDAVPYMLRKKDLVVIN
jgi:type II secretory pathway component PulC